MIFSSRVWKLSCRFSLESTHRRVRQAVLFIYTGMHRSIRTSIWTCGIYIWWYSDIFSELFRDLVSRISIYEKKCTVDNCCIRSEHRITILKYDQSSHMTDMFVVNKQANFREIILINIYILQINIRISHGKIYWSNTYIYLHITHYIENLSIQVLKNRSIIHCAQLHERIKSQ